MAHFDSRESTGYIGEEIESRCLVSSPGAARPANTRISPGSVSVALTLEGGGVAVYTDRFSTIKPG